MNNLNDLENTDQAVAVSDNTYWKTMQEDLDSLHTDDRFKRVILEGYFKDRAVNGVSMLASGNVVDNGLRPQVMEDLVAISRLQDYFLTISNLGGISEEDEEDMDMDSEV